MSDYELITSEIAEELEAGSFTVKQVALSRSI